MRFHPLPLALSLSLSLALSLSLSISAQQQAVCRSCDHYFALVPLFVSYFVSVRVVCACVPVRGHIYIFICMSQAGRECAHATKEFHRTTHSEVPIMILVIIATRHVRALSQVCLTDNRQSFVCVCVCVCGYMASCHRRVSRVDKA